MDKTGARDLIFDQVVVRAIVHHAFFGLFPIIPGQNDDGHVRGPVVDRDATDWSLTLWQPKVQQYQVRTPMTKQLGGMFQTIGPLKFESPLAKFLKGVLNE